MQKNSSRAHAAVRLGACGLAAIAGVAFGCASDGADEPGNETRVLQPGDFARGSHERTGSSPESSAPSPAIPRTGPPDKSSSSLAHAPKTLPETLQIGTETERPSAPPRVETTESTPAAAPQIVATPGLPAPNASARPLDRPIIVDAVVGQINGKPVFASEILEPLHGRLQAFADQTRTRTDFRTGAEKVVYDQLRRRIEEELALSEARAGLAPEVRAGLFHVINDIRNSLVSQQRGSQVAADESLRQSQGRSLDQEARQVLDRELIQNELRSRVTPRVQVTWRDIQQEYERNYDKYHPRPTARLRMIQVAGPAGGSEGENAAKYRDSVGSIGTALASQTSFEALASQAPNEFLRAKGGLMERQFDGDYRAGAFSPVGEINTAARDLEPGKWAGPIIYTDSEDKRERTAWVYLDSIDRPSAVSLEDAQLDIEQSLQERRMQRELAKYLNSLSSRGNVSDIKAMTSALTDIAVERYVPPSRK